MDQPSKKETAGTVEPIASETNTTNPSERHPAILTAKQAAELIRVSTKTVYRMFARGGIPGGAKKGRVLYFDRAVVTRWVTERRARAAAPWWAARLPVIVECPFCAAELVAEWRDDRWAVYSCTSACCVWRGYRRMLAADEQGEVARDWAMASNIGSLPQVLVDNHTGKANVTVRTKFGRIEERTFDEEQSLLDVIRRMGAAWLA